MSETFTSAMPTTPTPKTESKIEMRIRPLVAWRAIRRLIADPDETEAVFEIIDALSGKNGEHNFQRFVATETGQRILAEERDITARLMDLDTLRAMPEGSLGRTYASFMTDEQLSADGLAKASQWGEEELTQEDADRTRFGVRLRDTHDLWHVVTGYNRDLVGEASLLAFTYAQIKNRGIGFIVAMAYFLAGKEEGHGRRMMREAYRRGKKAEWMPAADWEALLEQPLTEVRRELGVGDPPVYREVRSAAGEVALTSRA